MEEFLIFLLSLGKINPDDVKAAESAVENGYDSLSDAEKKRLEKYDIRECRRCNESILDKYEKMEALENGGLCSGCVNNDNNLDK
jgi:hypothetical protein